MADSSKRLQWLRWLMIAQLVLLVLEYEFGESLAISGVFPQVPPSGFSLEIFSRYVLLSGAGTVLHAALGIGLLAIALTIVLLSWPTKTRSLRVTTTVAAVFVLLAGVGGLAFVLSGFSDNSFSYQMSTSFILAFVFTFLAFYVLRTRAPLPETTPS